MRLFIGAPVQGHDALRTITEDLCGRVPHARPVPDGTWHVTLRFLGDLDDLDPVREALDGALSDPSPITCTGTGVGAFSRPDRASIAWAALSAPGLDRLAAVVQHATTHLGKPPDRRAFVPHVTLARMRRPADVRAWMDHHAGTTWWTGVLDRIVLYESTLTPDGPCYSHAATWALPQP